MYGTVLLYISAFFKLNGRSSSDPAFFEEYKRNLPGSTWNNVDRYISTNLTSECVPELSQLRDNCILGGKCTIALALVEARFDIFKYSEIVLWISIFGCM